MKVFCRNKADCLTIWDVLNRWRHISLAEFQALINGNPPELQPYETVMPHSGEPDCRTLSLRPVERGELTFRDDDGYVITLNDASGHAMAANVDMVVPDEHNAPLVGDSIYFLVEDVAKNEQPRFLAEPLTAPLTAGDRPARSVGRMLRVADAAKICGISESEFWKRVRAGKLPRGIKLAPR